MRRTRWTADEVVNLLQERFPDLTEDPVRGIVLRAVTDQLDHPTDTFEVVLDNPITANWRLKPHLTRPGAFRVADCRLVGTSSDARVDRINELLEG